jgi:hypothetical protein
MLPAHEEILSIQLVTNNKYARQVRSCAAGFTLYIQKSVSENAHISVLGVEKYNYENT